MTAPNDRDLLESYVRTRDPEVLGDLVRRHLDMVYASALRQVRDASVAQDVAQAVFVVLVKKAPALRGTTLAGWLFTTTRYCAANAVRSQRRRRTHERAAAKPEIQMPTTPPESAARISQWLDEAIGSLGNADRDVVVLRYLQGRDFAQVAQVLGITEMNARKRLSRAIEKLRRYFAARGVTADGEVLSAGLAGSILHAPAELASVVTAAAANHAAASATAAALSNHALHAMFWAKAKIAAMFVGAALVLAAGGTAIVLRADAQPAPPPLEIAQAVPAAQPPAGEATKKDFTATFSDGMTVELMGIRQQPVSGDSDKLAAELRMRLPVVSFAGTRLQDCVDFLQDVTGIHIEVDWINLEPLGIVKSTPIRLPDQKNARFSDVLDKILDAAGNGKLGYSTQGGVITITTKEQLANLPVDKDEPWWRPDGSPLAAAPLHKIFSRVTTGDNELAYEVAARISNLNSLDVRWVIPRASGWSSSGSDGGPDVMGIAVKMPADPTATFRLEIAMGPWKTQATCIAGGGNAVGLRDSVIIFSPSIDVRGDCHITVAHSLLDQDVRIIAVGLDGKEHYPSETTGSSAGKIQQTSCTFSNLPVRRIKEFQFRTHSYDRWVEFRNVSLVPGKLTHVAITTNNQKSP